MCDHGRDAAASPPRAPGGQIGLRLTSTFTIHHRSPRRRLRRRQRRRRDRGPAYRPNLYEVGPAHVRQAPLRHDPGLASTRTRPAVDTPGATPGSWSCLPGHAAGRPDQPARRLLREPDHRLAGEAPGRRPRRLPGGTLVPARSSTAAPSAATPTSPTDWYDKVGGAHLGRQPDRLRRRRSSTCSPRRRQRPHGARVSSPPATRPRIDGFDLRGGDQQGFPGNLNEIGGGPTGLPPSVDDPGRGDLRQRLRPQPPDHEQRRPEQRRRLRHDPDRHADLPAPDTNQHNENVRIANNRIVANAGHEPRRRRSGSSPASDGYEVARNDICGNFSARVRRRPERLRPAARTARSTTTASTTTSPTTRAAAS